MRKATVVLAAVAVVSISWSAASAPLSSARAADDPRVGAEYIDTSGEERVLAHKRSVDVFYCGNPIRYTDLRLEHSTTYPAGADPASIWQQTGAGLVIPPAAAPAAAPSDTTGGGKRPLQRNSRQTPRPRSKDPLADEATRYRHLVNEAIAYEVLAVNDPVLKADMAQSALSALLRRSRLMLGRVQRRSDCVRAAQQLIGADVHQNDKLPNYLHVPDTQVNELIIELVKKNPAPLCWSNSDTVYGILYDLNCALNVARPRDDEVKAQISALTVLKAAIDDMKRQPGWAKWYVDTNRVGYDAVAAKAAYALDIWSTIAAHSTTYWKNYDANRVALDAWRARLAALKDSVLPFTPAAPGIASGPVPAPTPTPSPTPDPIEQTFVMRDTISCAGAQARGKAVRVVLKGSDPVTTDPQPAPVQREIITIVCPALASASYGLGAAMTPERHFVIAKAVPAAGATGAPNAVDNDVIGEQIPVAAYLGHWSLADVGDGAEVHLSAGPAFGQSGTTPGLFYGLSYSRDRASYLSAGFTLSKTTQLSGGFKVGDVVTPDVTAPPTRTAWRNAFTLMLSFPIRTAGSNPAPAPTATPSPVPSATLSPTPSTTPKPKS